MVDISIADKSDVDEIAKIHHQLNTEHYNAHPDLFKEPDMDLDKSILNGYASSNPCITIFKAVDDHKICGYLVLSVYQEGYLKNNSACVFSFAVDKAYRRKGIGKLLMAKAEEFSKSNNVKEISLYVRSFNIPALALYDELGYKDTPGHKSKLL